MSDWMTRVVDREREFRKSLEELRKKKVKPPVKDSGLMEILFPNGVPKQPFKPPMTTDTMTSPINPFRQGTIAGRKIVTEIMTGNPVLDVSGLPITEGQLTPEAAYQRDVLMRDRAIEEGKEWYVASSGNRIDVRQPLTKEWYFPSFTGKEEDAEKVVEPLNTYTKESRGIATGQYNLIEDITRPFREPSINEQFRRERFANSPDLATRIANTPTVIFGLTPADIAGLGTIALGGVEAIQAIRSFTAFSRLPQYKAMESFAKDQNIPKDSPVFQNAQNALKTAYSAYKQGMTELADEIIANFNRAYGGAMAGRVGETAETRLALGTRPIPAGTQTGAMAFGGKQAPITGQQIAASLGVKYDGVQKGAGDIPDMFQFTDPQTGSTTYGNTLKEAQANLAKLREGFAAKTAPTSVTQEAGKAVTPEVTELPKAGQAEAMPPSTSVQTGQAKYSATPAGAEARATAEGISISEASRLNAEESLKAPTEPIKEAVTEPGGELPPVEPPKPPTATGGAPPVQPPIEPPAGSVTPPPKPTPIQKVREFYKAKIADLEAVTKDKIASLKDWANYNVTERARVKGILTDYIQENLPLRERGKLIDAVKNTKDQKGLDDVIARVDRMAEESTQRQLRADILKELKQAAPKKEKGILKGKYVAGVQIYLDGIKHNINLSRNAARAKIAENIDRFTKGTMSEEDMLTQNEMLNLVGIKEMSSDELSNVLATIQELKQTGRSARLAKFKAQQIERQARNARIVTELTGGGEVVKAVGVPEVPKEESAIGRFFNRNYSFGTLLEKMAKLSGTEPRQSELANLDRVAYAARETENEGLLKAFDEVQAKAEEIWGVKGSKLADVYKKLSTEETNLGKFKFIEADGAHWREVKATKGQLIKKYQEMQDSTLDNTFEKGMHWPYELRVAVLDSLTAQEKAWADFQMGFYQKYYDSINQIFGDKYGVDLPHNQFYSPLRRAFESDVPEDMLVYEDLANYASVLNGSLKSRIRNIQPLKWTDANEVFINHIQQMEHFKAWVNPISELRSVFADKEVRTAIEQYHGKDILNQAQELIDRFARAGVDRAHTIGFLDRTRARFSRAVLGYKPSIAVQQLTTNLAYLTEMSVKDYTTGLADFWSNPVANFKWAMKNSTYIRSRYNQGFERDIRAAKEQNLYRKAFSGKGSVKDWSYALMTMGDQFGVIPGWWAKYKISLKAGLTPKQAMVEAGMATDRTQNTSAIDTLSTIQSGGSFWKLLTMFQSQPNKYFQIVANSVRNLQYDKGSKIKNIGSIILIAVILPALFQFINDGFRIRKERQATALMPTNNLLVAGQISRMIGNWLSGENFNYQVTPVTAPITDIGTFIQKGLSLWKKSQNPDKEITVDDMAALIESLIKPAVELTGLPTYLIQAEKALRGEVNKEGERTRDLRELIFSRYALEPEAPKENTSSNPFKGKNPFKESAVRENPFRR